MKSFMIICLFSIQLFILSTAFAGTGGSMDGGGGSYVVIDGKVQIADPYYAGRPASSIDQITKADLSSFPKEIKDYIDQTGTSLSLVFSDKVFDNKIAKFFSFVSSRNYFLVPKNREQNVPCEKYLPVLNIKVDEHFQFGCTFGSDTYLFIDKFSRGSIEQQALALVHESLWALAVESVDQKTIADFVTWTPVLVSRALDQSLKKDQSLMPEVEIEGMKSFINAAVALNLLGESPDWNLYTIVSGGAVVQTSAIDFDLENSFLGIGTLIMSLKKLNTIPLVKTSLLIKNSRLANVIISSIGDLQIQDSELTNSLISVNGYDTKSLNIIKESTIIDSLIFLRESIIGKSNITKSKIFDGALISNCNFNEFEFWPHYSPGNKIKSKFDHVNIKKSYYSDQNYEFSIINYADISDSKISRIMINGEENSRVQLLNARLGYNETNLTIEAGSKIDRIDVEWVTAKMVHIDRNSNLFNVYVRGGSGVLNFEANTTIRGAQIGMSYNSSSCKQDVVKFYIGSDKKPTVYENIRVDLKPSIFNCSKRYAP